MAIIVKTDDPAKLLKAIYKSIDDEETRTWAYDKDKDFSHTPAQWADKAWLRPSIPTTVKDELRFGIIIPKTTTNSRYMYGLYHGRFIEMLLTHFDEQFTSARATAMPISIDSIIE